MLARIAKFILKFLPTEYRNYFEIGERMFSRLDTKDEIQDAATFLIDSLKSDGYLSAAEWGKLGGKLGIIGKPKPKPNTEPIFAPTI
jgi:hypothetical protein